MAHGIVPNSDRQYICPGEETPISHAVHMGRLAAFYPACRNCPFNDHTATLPVSVQRAWQREEQTNSTLTIGPESLHGVFRNELTAAEMENVASAFADHYWQQHPRNFAVEVEDPHPMTRLPVAVLGFDHRPASAQLAIAAARALRKMCCEVVDIGVVSRPIFWHAAMRTQAAMGLFVSASGKPERVGLECLGPRQIPLTDFRGEEQTTLTWPLLWARKEQSFSRPFRRSGKQRVLNVFPPYRDSLRQHFHALRPLTITIATANPCISQFAETLLADLPVMLKSLTLPQRDRDLHDPHDADILRAGQAVRDEAADFGMLIHDDGQHTSLLDHQGRLLPAVGITLTLADAVRHEHPAETILVESRSPARLTDLLSERGFRFQKVDADAAATATKMRSTRAVFSGGPTGRYWFREGSPTSDALLTLAKILGVLSQTDRPLSDVVAKYQ